MRRIISWFCVLAVLTGIYPITLTAAAKAGAWDGSVDISWYDPEKDEYYLSTPAQLAGLAALVNGMADPQAKAILGDPGYLESIRVENVLLVGVGGGNVSDTVYTSNIDFSGKTVYLTADMDMGGRQDADGNWNGPNWTPIGGKFPMKPEEAEGDFMTLDTRFNGALDGQGHCVSNLYCDRYAEKGFPYSMAVGLIGFLGGACDNNEKITWEFENEWQPAVRNIKLASGYVYGRRMVGGIVGRVGETSHGVIIESCANAATVRSTDSKGVGGICGSAWGSGCIRNCYNTGDIFTTYTCPAGGILGSNSGMDVYNCYNTGRVDTCSQQYGRGIGGHDSGTYTVNNCYYLEGCDDDPSSEGYYKGTSKKISVSCQSLTAEEMQSSRFVDQLNANGGVFTSDRKKINQGYPVLWFETEGPSSMTCIVAAETPENGTITVSNSGEIALGETVVFSAQPAPGYLLEYYTVNGDPIPGNFYTVTQESRISAVFKKLRTVSIRWEDNDAYYLAVRRSGWSYDDQGQMFWVEKQSLHSGDTVLEGNVLTLLYHAYENASPADPAMEYRAGVQFEVSGAEKNADGTFAVTGKSNVSIAGQRNIQAKTWISCADKSWYTGKQKNYTITTAEELAGLAALVNGGVDFTGITIRLGADISLDRDSASGSQRIWTAIGSSVRRAFCGRFDGQGHWIRGLRAWNQGSYAALFGCCVNAELLNLQLSGSSTGEAAASYAAGLASYAENCTIKNCSAYVNVTAAGTHAGGLAAYIAGGSMVENCFNYGTICGVSGVGGLIGVSYSGEDQLAGCANFGAVMGSGSGTYGTGGIVGRLAGVAEKCVNYGNVSGGDRYTGGVAGYTTARNKTKLFFCGNEGSVSSENTEQRAATGALVGYAQNLIWSGCTAVRKDEQPLFGTAGNVQERAAAGEVPVYTPMPEKEKTLLPEQFTVFFRANDTVIKEIHCPSGTTAVSEPAVPEREGFTGSWSAYTLDGYDVTVQAIYREILAEEEIRDSGVYFIPWFATGKLTIAEGMEVTLCGNGEPVENLCIVTEKNVCLTLKNVSIAGDTTLLQLGVGTVLKLQGQNSLDGWNDAPENLNPTVKAEGDLTICGDGGLYVSAQVNNAAVKAAEGSKVCLQSGDIRIFKTDKLGLAGGAFYANGAVLKISGGSFSGRTDSDNVPVISADSILVTDAVLRVAAERSPQAILGKISLKDCEVTASGHTGKSAEKDIAYTGEKALEDLREQSGVHWKEPLPYTDVTVEQSFYEAVSYCYEQGWLQGTAKDAFSPAGNMSRRMFITALWRMEGSPAAVKEHSFSDVLKNRWYTAAVSWAAEQQLMGGTAPGIFSPDAPVTIEQTAVILRRWLRIPPQEIKTALPEGTGGVSPWAKESVAWAAQAGILGQEDLLAPTEASSRAFLAQLLYRCSKLVQ